MVAAREKFLKCFAKYKPNDNAVWLLDMLTDFCVKINREQRKVKCVCTASKICDCDTLTAMEQEIARQYALAEMKILVSYPSELFEKLSLQLLVDIMQQRCGRVGNGFFDMAKGKYDTSTGEYAITLAHGLDVSLLYGVGADKCLSQTAKEAFGLDVSFTFYGQSEDIQYIAPEYEQMKQETQIMLGSFIQNESAAIQTASFDPLSEAPEPLSENDEEKVYTCGKMKFDLSELSPMYGKQINMTKFRTVRSIYDSTDTFTFCGEVYKTEKKESRDGDRITFTWYITDNDSSALVRITEAIESCNDLKKIKPGASLILTGKASKDTKYIKDYVFKPTAVAVIKRVHRKDTAENPRIELHLHTNMSQMDGMSRPAELVRLAKEWNLPALCVTDHGNVQAFPDIMLEAEKQKYTGKLIYGMEGYLVDDTARAAFGADGLEKTDFSSGSFVIFDIETTGLSPETCGITEIAAARYVGGECIDTFETYCDPGMPVPEEITRLTGITDEMLIGAPSQEEAVRSFLEYTRGEMLVAHNAVFDTGFIRMASQRAGLSFNNPYIDTLALSRYLNPELKRHRLDNLRDYFKLGEFNHHRALDDTLMLLRIFDCMVKKLRSEGVKTLGDLENEMELNINPKKLPSYHVTILVKNKTGLQNLYQLISDSYLLYFSKHPRIPKTHLTAHREGLIIGSACEAGEVFSAIRENKAYADQLKIADFYDYFEIMPLTNNAFFIDDNILSSYDQIKDINRKIIAIADKQKKPVVATGDVHFLEPEDEIFRQIMLAGMKMSGADRKTKLYFRTTQEMLEEFSYLPSQRVKEFVIDNPLAIADSIEYVRPIPEGAFNPSIEGSDDTLVSVCHERAKELYGDPIPDIVENRLDRELDSVIKNGYSALYITARELVRFSERNGYLCGSRGSVGSSVIATLAGISEVNPLPPHYRCPNCRYNEFITDQSVGSGFDLPDKNCPNCGTKLIGDGHDIPFETFLGFKGDKAPDIDLNFSGEIQAGAHKYTEVLFGAENVFRAGTISTLAEKTAFGFVKKYLESGSRVISKCEEERLVCGTMGVKRTTGQHPGGIVVVPRPYKIQDFTPVQHPADKDASNVITTHFAFDYLHDTLQKLDILGHDVPTRIKVLEDYTGINVKTVPMNDKDVMSLFFSTDALGIKPEDIDGITLGTLAIPECGTENARQMILDAKPKLFSDLMQFSGLSHGEGIWQGNGKSLIENGTCTISQVIGTRDSIMLSLIKWGLEPSQSFKIMEDVRKGRGLKPEYEDAMNAAGVPAWYIRSCKKIQYMFPKAHAAAYMIASLRLSWYKVHYPLEHYASYFTVQPNGFEAQTVMKGKKAVVEEMEAIKERLKNKTAVPKDSDVLTALQIANEMYARGIKLLPVNIFKSDKKAFVPEEGKIRLPLSSLAGLGDTAAENIWSCMHGNEDITSLEELKIKAGLTKSVVDTLRDFDCLGGMAETEQITMF
ncbi:MAG TPA: PolC-type DNA polymerase III [Bacillota bacterium]|nr:PolC-type DNA polymerase III [Bacillota bacterium]